MKKIKKILLNWVSIIVFVIVIVLVINKFILFVILVLSGFMYFIIKLKDRIIIIRIYNFNNIKRGDILVFYFEEL